MIEIKVAAKSSSYPIFVGQGLIDRLVELCHLDNKEQAFLISDRQVFALYGEKLLASLASSGAICNVFVTEGGEAKKSIEEASAIYHEMLAAGCGRKVKIIALGGGVVGDLSGFVAATYMRGVPFIQVPTTLLSQVDSSVGGKTGVNFEGYKNIIGAFHQPSAVISDLDLLASLTDREFGNGMAEVVKTALLSGGRLMELARFGMGLRTDLAALQETVALCCGFKAAVVEEDERESGHRRILNLGHTLGHAIEKLTDAHEAHGQAVAIGMAFAAFYSSEEGLCEKGLYDDIRLMLKACSLPTTLPDDLQPDTLASAMMKDKKKEEGRISFILLSAPGSVVQQRVSERDIIRHLTNFKENGL